MTLAAQDTPSTRPYLIRALYEWCTENGFSPYLAVQVDASVRVPMDHVKNGEIVLNISFDATSGMQLGNEFIEFKARFGGVAREIVIPVSHVTAIYARENGQGMAFPAPAVQAHAPHPGQWSARQPQHRIGWERPPKRPVRGLRLDRGRWKRHTLAIFSCVNGRDVAHRNDDLPRHTPKTGFEFNELIAQLHAAGRIETDVEHNLAVFDVVHGHTHRRIDLNRQIRRKAVFGAPLIQCPNQVRAGGRRVLSSKCHDRTAYLRITFSDGVSASM